MRIVFTVFILVVLFFKKESKDVEQSIATNTSIEVLDTPPEFYVLDWKKGTKLSPQKTSLYIAIDSIGRQEVLVLINEDKTPVLYASEIATPVCADGECKLMHIKFYWTLLGEYAGFDRDEALPLTKYDHDEFQQSDYQKLHELLIDDKSIIGRRTIDQLVDKPKMRVVNGVDAISGATVARVKEAVVQGALYSCYTAWHLVYGDIQDKLKNKTLSILNEKMTLSMLYSSNQEYQLFALDNIDDSNYKKHIVQLVEVFKTTSPLVRSIIAKRITSKFADSPELQKPFWEAFDEIDSGSKSLLVKYLKDAPKYVPTVLSSKLNAMSKNQLITFLNYLSSGVVIDSKVQDNLEGFSNSETTYAYLVKEFIEETK